ncbi:MAG: hypothetical protein Q4F80_03080 [bacterium]|nr:hypothetical protein [bacterium]
MRISPVCGLNYGTRKINSAGKSLNNSPNFKGETHTKIFRFEKEDDVRDYLTRDDVVHLTKQSVITGKVPLQRIKGTFAPDILMMGKVYYADEGEYVGDWAKGTHSAVVCDPKHENITPEIARDDAWCCPLESIEMMQETLKRDICHQKSKIKRTTNQDEKQQRSARLEELKSLKVMADDTHARTIQYLKDRHYYDEYVKKLREQHEEY